jgi:hypothetical protein
MSDLTSVVRPNETPDIRPALGNQLRTAAPITAPVDDGSVTWGGSGNSAFQLRANAKSELPPILEEQSRKYDKVKVKNPDDPEQYVETEVMTEYQARNKIDKSRFILRFGETKASDNVEIISKGNIRKSEVSS